MKNLIYKSSFFSSIFLLFISINIQIFAINSTNCTGIQTYEAENATLTGTNIQTSTSGYSGSGYVSGFDNTDDKVSFQVAVNAAGNYPMTIRYAASSEKQNYIYVNGTLVETVLFPASTQFTEIAALDLTLNAGANTVEIVKYWGWFDLDYIKIDCAGTPVPDPNFCNIGTNFWDIRWGNTYSDSFQPNVNFATTNNPWNSTFLQETSIYEFYRFMDWGPVNRSTVASWNDRISPSSNQTQGVAYEWQIDLCNRQNKDMWICIPHLANDNYIQQLATLIKNNLNPNLKCYIEYSNETWNGIFDQAFYAYDQAQILGLPNYVNVNGSLVATTATDPWEAAFLYQVIGAINVWENFELVFGSDMDTRINKVLAGWQGNSWLAARHLAILDDPNWNPSGIEPDSYSVGAYAGHNVDGNTSQTFPDLIEDIYVQRSNNLQVKNLLAGRCYEYTCYEGGQRIADYSTSAGNNSDIANRDPQMYNFYTLWLDANKDVFDHVAHYCHTGGFASVGSWGAKEYTGQPNIQAHKYRAILDWTNNSNGNCPGPVCSGTTCNSVAARTLGLGTAQKLSSFLLNDMDHNLKNIQNLYIQNQYEINKVFDEKRNDNGKIKELLQELKPTVIQLTKNAFLNNSSATITTDHINQFGEFLIELEFLVENKSLKENIAQVRNSICVMENKDVKEALNALGRAKLNACKSQNAKTVDCTNVHVTGLSSSNISSNSATISWTAISAATGYNAEYKPIGGSWSTAESNTPSNSLNLSGLSASTDYEWRVRAFCPSGNTTFFYEYFTTSNNPQTNVCQSDGKCVPYNSEGPWNSPICDNPPIHSNSGTFISAIADNNLPLTSDRNQYAIAVFLSDNNTPRANVQLSNFFSYYDNGDDSRVSPGSGSLISDVPIPANAEAGVGTDGQIIFWDPVEGVEWGFWQFKKVNGNYMATNGYRYHTTQEYNGRFADGLAGRGAGTTYFSGLVRKWEIEQGHIDHALSFAYEYPSAQHVYPASKSDGSGVNGTDLPEGTRLQLDPTLTESDFNNWGLNGPAKIIAKALQEYGMIVIDKSGSSKIYLEDQTTANWGPDVDRNILNNIPWNQFRVLEVESTATGCGTTCNSAAARTLGLRTAQKLSSFLLNDMDHNLKNIQSLYIKNQYEINRVFDDSRNDNAKIKELLQELKPTVIQLIKNAFLNKSSAIISTDHINQFSEFLFELEFLVQNKSLKESIAQIRNSICVMENKDIKEALIAMDKTKPIACKSENTNTFDSDIITFKLVNSVDQTSILYYNVATPGTLQIQLFNLNGKLIQTIANNKITNKGSYQQKIEMNQFNTGIYFIRTIYSHQNGQEYFSEKIIGGQY